jgi:hypothetical protein
MTLGLVKDGVTRYPPFGSQLPHLTCLMENQAKKCYIVEVLDRETPLSLVVPFGNGVSSQTMLESTNRWTS